MIIGKIVSAGSHVEYVCQVYGDGEAAETPAPGDYGFGVFVGIERAPGRCLVGLVANTTLMNPDFGNLGPRLSPEPDLAVFSPDYLAEQATLVTILVIGSIEDASPRQGISTVAAAIDDLVRVLGDDEIALFHVGSGRLQLQYLPVLLGMGTSPLLPALAQQVITDLTERLPAQAGVLSILRRNLAWRASVLPAG